ncbi:MAG: hypothetical protein MJZ54_01575 [Bacteroidaceae bacterium]|nr:hypothetical protein [Bacteroidaceae bacterium]
MSKKNKKEKHRSPLAYWREVMGGKYLTGETMRRNIKYLLLIILLAIIYVSNRYQCQQAMIQGKQLTDTLMDRRYKALTAQSQLKKATLRSHVEKNLPDSTIKTPNDPMFVVK